MSTSEQLDRVICWNSLSGHNGGYGHVEESTLRDIVEHARGIINSYIDDTWSDEDIIDDFMVKHYAWFKEECADD